MVGRRPKKAKHSRRSHRGLLPQALPLPQPLSAAPGRAGTSADGPGETTCTRDAGWHDVPSRSELRIPAPRTSSGPGARSSREAMRSSGIRFREAGAGGCKLWLPARKANRSSMLSCPPKDLLWPLPALRGFDPRPGSLDPGASRESHALPPTRQGRGSSKCATAYPTA